MRVVGILICLAIAVAAQQPAADDPLNAAVNEQQHGDYEAAIRDYRKVLQAHPDMVKAKVNLGAALAHVGQFDEAITMYRSALPSVSLKNPIILNIGLAYYKKGDFAGAREQFEAVHQVQPKDARVAVLLGDADLRLQKAAEAVAVMEPLAAGNADNLDFEYVFGSALIASGRRREGVPHVEKVAHAGDIADAYLLAGVTLFQLNEFEPARRDLEAALRLNSKLPNIYTLVGTARDKTGDVKNAEAAFREALKANPDDFDASLYLGTILYQRRELDEAGVYLGHALELNPTNSMARYEDAMLKSAAGQYEKAAQELEKLVKDDPQWLDPHVQLATLYYKLHRPEDGARERQTVQRLTTEQQSKGPGS